MGKTFKTLSIILAIYAAALLVVGVLSFHSMVSAAPAQCSIDKVVYYFEVLPADVFSGGPDAVAEYFTHMQNIRGYALVDIMMIQGVPFVVYSRPVGYIEPEATPTLEQGSSA